MSETIVFTGANLFDGKGACRPGSTIVVANGRITGVGRGEAPSDARVIDLGGKTLMPGMTVGHWHGEFVSIGPPRFGAGRGGIFLGTEEPPVVLALAAATALKTALLSGVTRVVSGSCGNDSDWQLKVAMERGLLVGPHITPCSRHVVTTGDYEDRGHWWTSDLQMANSIRRIGCNVFSDGPEQLAKAVRQEILRGAEIIKLLPVGGHGLDLNESYRGMSRAELEIAVGTAHERGARVRAHTSSKRSILECIEVGVDIIDHADELDDECIEAMVKHGSTFIPSMLFTKLVGYGGVGESRPDVQLDQAWDNMMVMLPRANAAGINIVPGDDFGGQGMEHALGVYARELVIYTDDIGISGTDVLRWATINGAKLGLDDKNNGSIEEGKIADLLVVDGDPTRDLGLLLDPERNLTAIMLGGRFVKDRLNEAGVDRAPRPDKPAFDPVIPPQTAIAAE